MERKALLLVATFVAATGIIASAGTAEAAPTTASVTATPSTGLKTGQSVTVTGSGWPASAAINLIECATPVTGVSDCDLGTLKQVTSTAAGTFSIAVTVHTGVVGTGSCDPGKGCEIAVATATQTVTGQAAISFASTAPTPTPTTTKPSATPTGGGSTTPEPPATSTGSAGNGAASTGASDPRTPVSVPAGSGGHADESSVSPLSIAALLTLGLGLIVASSRRVLRRHH